MGLRPLPRPRAPPTALAAVVLGRPMAVSSGTIAASESRPVTDEQGVHPAAMFTVPGFLEAPFLGRMESMVRPRRYSREVMPRRVAPGGPARRRAQQRGLTERSRHRQWLKVLLGAWNGDVTGSHLSSAKGWNVPECRWTNP